MFNRGLTSYFSDFLSKLIPQNPYVLWFDAAVEKMIELRLKSKVSVGSSQHVKILSFYNNTKSYRVIKGKITAIACKRIGFSSTTEEHYIVHPCLVPMPRKRHVTQNFQIINLHI